MARPSKKWTIKTFASSGSNTLLAGIAGKMILLKQVIFTVDSATNVYICDDQDRHMTCTFYFGSIGAWDTHDGADFNVNLGTGRALCINSSKAVNGSIMFTHELYLP